MYNLVHAKKIGFHSHSFLPWLAIYLLVNSSSAEQYA